MSGVIPISKRAIQVSKEARRIIDSMWTPGEWPPNGDTVMALMQLAVSVGRLSKPGWCPEGVNEPFVFQPEKVEDQDGT